VAVAIRAVRFANRGIRQQVSGYRTSLCIRYLAARHPPFPQSITVTFAQPLTVIPAKAGVHDAAKTAAAKPET
jgi:hypothetical protein